MRVITIFFIALVLALSALSGEVYAQDSVIVPPHVQALPASVPVGTIIEYHGTTAPDGFFACTGQAFNPSTYPRLYAVLGKAATPDMRGMFVRGYDTRNIVDPDGASRSVGSLQVDAGRNISGSFSALLQTPTDIQAHGAFAVQKVQSASGHEDRRSAPETPIYELDASRSWGVAHTAMEFRPINISLLFCIKHD
jgi:microcystin-dependent protein